MERGTGMTTSQMYAAPQGAIYVWCNGHLSYPQLLARRLNRTDLTIVSEERLRDKLISARRPVVVDHAANIGRETAELIAARGERFSEPKPW